MNNNVIVKCKIDDNLGMILKLILNKLNITQQDFLETKIKEFVVENVHLVVANTNVKDGIK